MTSFPLISWNLHFSKTQSYGICTHLFIIHIQWHAGAGRTSNHKIPLLVSPMALLLATRRLRERMVFMCACTGSYGGCFLLQTYMKLFREIPIRVLLSKSVCLCVLLFLSTGWELYTWASLFG